MCTLICIFVMSIERTEILFKIRNMWATVCFGYNMNTDNILFFFLVRCVFGSYLSPQWCVLCVWHQTKTIQEGMTKKYMIKPTNLVLLRSSKVQIGIKFVIKFNIKIQFDKNEKLEKLIIFLWSVFPFAQIDSLWLNVLLFSMQILSIELCCCCYMFFKRMNSKK